MSSTPKSPPSGATPATTASSRGIFVHVAILITALIFLGTVLAIYYRWLTVQEPTTVLVLNADEALDGAVATVEGVVLAEPLVAVIDERSRYRARFFLHPGSYTVRVEREGDVVYQQPLMLEHGGGRYVWQINLTTGDRTSPREP